MKTTLSLIAAAATLGTALPTAVAVPTAASAYPVRVEVGPPGGWYYRGRHWRHRYWRHGAWVYDGPFGGPAMVAGGGGRYFWGGRHYYHRGWNCHGGWRGRQACAWRYW